MTTAGKILTGLAVAAMVLVLVLQAVAPLTANAVMPAAWLLLIVGVVLWLVGRRQDRQRT